jgi:8-oxo-dGTP pyrophosphatase MutT (NUDIX family)
VRGHVVGSDTIEETLVTEAKEEIGLELLKKEFTIQYEELSELLYMNYNVLRERMKSGYKEIAPKWGPQYEELFAKFDKLFLKTEFKTYE